MKQIEGTLDFCDVTASNGERRKIAYIKSEPAASLTSGAAPPGVMWLCGFRAHMLGEKSRALAEWSVRKGVGCLRFDYSGRGQSSGAFEDCVVGDWLTEAMEIFRKISTGPQVLAGSSMGGWIALLMARALAKTDPQAALRIKGIVTLAPAWDMTEDLIWRPAPEEIKRELMERGAHYQTTAFGVQATTLRLIEEGRNHLIGGAPFDPGAPVRIIHGVRDEIAPFQRSLALLDLLETDDLRLTFIKDGDHRLSRPQDLALLFSTLEELCGVNGCRA